MKIDLHCHTKYSCDNYLEPEELIEQALIVNLNGVCITEHFPKVAMTSRKGCNFFCTVNLLHQRLIY